MLVTYGTDTGKTIVIKDTNGENYNGKLRCMGKTGTSVFVIGGKLSYKYCTSI